MSVDHYENFPVASWLCPPALRPAVKAIYGFARTADDLADEGDHAAEVRLASMRSFRDDLERTAAGSTPGQRWAHVFGPLHQAMQAHALPLPLLRDLLSAFEQDVLNPLYPDRAALLDYCRRSANPIGRLLLHLYRVDETKALRQSDAICTALQLINFWQDLSVDTPRGRHYVPLSDLQQHGVSLQALRSLDDTREVRALVRTLCQWSEQLMKAGAPLVHRLPGRIGWELRLVVQGGLGILATIRRMDHATLTRRPRLHASDAPRLLWRACTMRRSGPPDDA